MTTADTDEPTPGEAGDHSPGRGGSLRDFLTDGALAAMCAELSRLSGFAIEVRDERGAIIEPAEAPFPVGEPVASPLEPVTEAVTEAAGGPRWRVVPAGEAPEIAPGAERFPMLVGGRVIGEIVAHPGDAHRSSDQPEGDRFVSLARTLRLLASTASELCTDVLAMRHRVDELGVLYRLTGLLTSGTPTVTETLDIALRSAIGVFGLDAGSIFLFPENASGPAQDDDEAELQMAASVGLSDAWTSDPRPLSRGRVFDARALAGEVVVVPDLSLSPDVNEPGRLSDEGLAGFFSAAMRFRGRPIGVIRLYSRRPRGFDEAEQRLLRSIGEQAAAAVEQARLLVIQQEERRMERQLRLAASVQHRMLPERLPSVAGVDIAARSVPSLELGGDLYDVFTLDAIPSVPSHDTGDHRSDASPSDDPQQLAIAIGDVVGKGVPAALLMAGLRASLRAVTRRPRLLESVLRRVNEDLTRDTKPNEFATLWYGVYEPDTRVLSYASAGHEPPLVVRCPAGETPTVDSVHPLAIGGLVLGIDNTTAYEASAITLEPGDVVIAYTDGLTDARNFDGERYGFARLAESIVGILANDPDASASAILEHAFWSVRSFVGLNPQTDDETLVVIRMC